MKLLKGIVFIVWLVITAFQGVIFLFPSLFVLPFSWSLYRKWTDLIAEYWFKGVVVGLEILNGIKMVFSGNDLKNIHSSAPSILISNHPTRLDWMMLWSFMLRFGNLSHEKIILKEPLKKAPLFGWGMQHFNFLFIKRNWDADKSYMQKLLNLYTSREYPLQLLLFPEGTDMSKDNMKKSQEFATKMGLPSYNNLLQPRTKGWEYCLSLLDKHVEYVYDITIGYPDLVPQNEKMLFTGEFPKEIHFYAKNII